MEQAELEAAAEGPGSEASPDLELRRGLMPKLAPTSDQPRVSLRREALAHRAECESRESRWEIEMADKLNTAEEVRQPGALKV